MPADCTLQIFPGVRHVPQTTSSIYRGTGAYAKMTDPINRFWGAESKRLSGLPRPLPVRAGHVKGADATYEPPEHYSMLHGQRDRARMLMGYVSRFYQVTLRK